MLAAAQNKNVQSNLITHSIVSHGHGAMVELLVKRLLEFEDTAQIVLTRNVPESFNLPQDERIVLIQNKVPMGFGANHNQAFKDCKSPFFCVINPDIALPQNPFPVLLTLQQKTQAALVAPLVVTPTGEVDDSARLFPTPFQILCKLFGAKSKRYDVARQADGGAPDWVAGMFMFFESKSYRELKGFDESYFLYYEDADICTRIWKNDKSLALCPTVSVVHDARRESHRNLKFLRWHLSSMLRYFGRYWLRLPR